MPSAKSLFVLVLAFALAGEPLADAPAGELLQSLHSLARPLRTAKDLDPLLEAVGDARLVLLGESSHGTREFYVWRDRLSRRLLAERGFSFVAIEGDWSSLVPLDRYVRHLPGAPASAREALLQIDRWPKWIWANAQLEALGEWLRVFNRDRPAARRVGVHGIDLYAIWESIDALRAFCRTHLPEAAARVDRLYGLLQRFRDDYRGYAEFVRRTRRSARHEVAWVVGELAARYRNARPDHRTALFEALQHARVVESGERFLRALPLGGPYSRNVRSDHFERTVARLLDHYGPGSRGIVWAHNTHVGDARATTMARRGEVSLGQLVRQRHGTDAVLSLGFGTATGNVLASSAWEGRRETMTLRVPHPRSLEAALLASGDGDRLLIFDTAPPAVGPLRRMLVHRAIGVVYEPQREPRVHYEPTRLADRYDAFIFLPHTHALDPLHAD